MAKRVVCDVCERAIEDGSNVGIRNPVFSYCFPIVGNGEHVVEVTTTARVNGNSGADLCLACLKEAVAKA